MEIDFESMDEEIAAQVRAALEAKEKELQAARAAAERRDLIYANQDIAAKYPRSVHALRLKLIDEPELAGEELMAWLENKEKEYAALGVPVPGQESTKTATAEPAQPAAQQEPTAENRAAGWGPATYSGQTPAINLTAELKEALISGKSIDADTIVYLDTLNQRDDGRKSIRELTFEMMDKRPLI